MNNKRLSISLLANIISTLVSLGVSFLLTPYLIITLGKEAYSFFPLANNFAGYMTIITMALNSMASRYITIALARGDSKKAHTYFSTVFFSNIIQSVALAVPMTAIVAFINYLLEVPAGLIQDVRILFSLIFAGIIINLTFSVFGIATFAKERMDWYALQNIGQNILKAVLYIGLFAIFSPSIICMGVVAVTMALFNGGMQYLFTRQLMPEYKVKLHEFNKAAVWELIGSGIWNSINSLGSSLLQSMALLMANIMVGAAAAGDLSIVQTLPNLMTTIICAVYGVLLPRIANVYAKEDKWKIAETVIFSQKVLGIISSTPVILIILFGRFFFQLWVPEENAAHLQILLILTIFPLLIHSSMWTVFGLNVMNNKLKKPALLFLIVGVINIVGTAIILKNTNQRLYIIPLVSGILNVLYYMVYIPSYAAKEMGLPRKTFYPHIIKTIAFALIAICIGGPIVRCLSINNWIHFFFYGGVAGCVCVLIYILIVFDRQDKKNFFCKMFRMLVKK